MSFSIIITHFLGTETGHWRGRITIQAERVLLKQQSMLLRHDTGDWRVSGLLRQERDAIRPLCLDPS